MRTQRFETPWGAVLVPDAGRSPRGPLRGWNAADEYVVSAMADDVAAGHLRSIAVVGERCGAISAALAGAGVTCYAVTDSSSQRALIAQTMRLNGLGSTPDSTRSSGGTVRMTTMAEPLPDHVDAVVVMIPLNNRVLEQRLVWIQRLSSGGIGLSSLRVMGAGMTRDIHRSTVGLFESMIGPTTTTLAKKKARLVLAESAVGGEPVGCQPGERYDVVVGDHSIEVVPVPGVFGEYRVDAGTALLLQTHEHWPTEGVERVVDIGCGTGILGIAAALVTGAPNLVLMDDSDAAAEAAELTVDANETLLAQVDVTIATGHDAGQIAEAFGRTDADLVIINPPFHAGHTMSDDVAWNMIRAARHLLSGGGELWLVGNRNLAYHAKLKRSFSVVETVASNATFVVLRAATKPFGEPTTA